MKLPSLRRPSAWFAALAATTAILFASCDESQQVTGRSDETHTSVVDIQGRVLTSDARPLPNVIVRLRSSGLTDTTDSDGAFRLQLDSVPVSASSVAIVDTLDYLRDGQAILSAAVPAWVTTMPDVMLVQRDLSGVVEGDPAGVARLVCQLWLPDGSTQWVDLEFNRSLLRYSAFAYFRYSGGRDSFAARVEAHDDSGRVLGRSVKLRFSSLAGDVAFPSFTVGNILPKVSLLVGGLGGTVSDAADTGFLAAWPVDSTVVARRQAVRLFARITDTLDRFTGLEWSVGGSAWVPHRGRGWIPRDASGRSLQDYVFDTVFSVPAGQTVGSRVMVRVRVLDQGGAVQQDTLWIKVGASRPSARVELDPQEAGGWVRPGARVRVYLFDSAFHGKRIVRRILHLAKRTEIHTTSSAYCVPMTSRDTIFIVDGRIVTPSERLGNPWVQPKELPSTEVPFDCRTSEMRTYYELDSVRPGITVSGADTTIALPTDSVAEYAFVYTVVDEDGEEGAASSLPIAARGPRPADVAIATEGDSLVVRWSSSGNPTGGTWLLEGRWNETGDSLRRLMSDSSRRAAFLQPLSARSAKLRLTLWQGGVAGIPFDTILPTLSHPGLRFTGALRDTTRLGGTGSPFGMAEAWFAAAVGADLVGEVARLEWSIRDTTEVSGAEVRFDLPARIGSRRLVLDLANRSVLPARIVVRAPSQAEYSQQVERGVGLGWDVPAGFVGTLSLPLDSASWPSWLAADSRPVLSTGPIFDALTGIQVTVVRDGQATPLRGTMEFDNLRWE